MQEFVIELYLNGFVTGYRSEYLRNDIFRKMSCRENFMFSFVVLYFIFHIYSTHYGKNKMEL